MKTKLIKTILVSSMILLSGIPVFNKIFAANIGVSAYDNGDGSITVVISGDCVGGFEVKAGGNSVIATKTTLDSNASARINTGYGDFTVNVLGISVSDANYELIEGYSNAVNVAVSNPNGSISQEQSPSNNTNNNPSNGNTTQPEETPTKKNEPEKQEEKNEEQSGDSSLSSLQVSKGNLSPSFASDVYEYTLQLDDSVEMLQVDAQANHQKANVEGLGEKALEHGENTLEIVCTAENGSTSTYTIIVNVTDKPSVYVNYGSAKLGVLSQADTSVLSNAFTPITLLIDGQEVSAWKNEAIPLTLVYLVNDKQEKDFYIYEEGKGVTSIYRPIALCGKNLVMIDIPQKIRERSHMDFGDIEVDGIKMLGWTFDDKAFSSYSLIYMMDEQGNKTFYQYEKTSNTLQTFSGAAAITQEKYDAYVNKQKRNTLVLGITTGVFVIVSLVLLYTTILFYRRKGNGKTFRKTDVRVQSLGRGSALEADVIKKEVNENKEDL